VLAIVTLAAAAAFVLIAGRMMGQDDIVAG
jgi:hypothetical protein